MGPYEPFNQQQIFFCEICNGPGTSVFRDGIGPDGDKYGRPIRVCPHHLVILQNRAFDRQRRVTARVQRHAERTGNLCVICGKAATTNFLNSIGKMIKVCGECLAELKPKPAPRQKRIKHTPAERARYSVLRLEYLRAHPVCEICGKAPSLIIHHRLGRAEHYLNAETFVAACKPCEDEVHGRVTASARSNSSP